MLYWLPEDVIPPPGGVAMMPLPGLLPLGRRVEDDLGLLVASGIGVLVSLTEDLEVRRLATPAFYDELKGRGIDSIRFPIRDGDAPRDLAATAALVDRIDALLGEGRRVGLHCLAGLGRTGTIAACLLIRRGATFHEAVRTVRQARSPRAIETATQEAFVASFAEWSRVRARR